MRTAPASAADLAREGVEMRLVVLEPGTEWAADAPRPKGAKITFDAGVWAPGKPGPILVVERKDHRPGDAAHTHEHAEGLTSTYEIEAQLKR